MQIAVSPGDVDALVDRGDVRRAGERPDDAAGTQNRQATENAQSRIHGFQRQRFAALDVDRDLETAGITGFFSEQGQVIADHLARHRVDGRFAHGQHQPWPGHRADPQAGIEANARFRHQPHLRIKQRTVGHVGIVAGILDRPGLGAVGGQPAELQTHLHLFAFGQDDLHGVHRDAAQQQACRRETGGGGAAAGGQPAAQGGGLFAGLVTHRGV